MQRNNSTSASASSEKRKLGFVFVPIRRGLLAHLREMSGNAVKLYLFLHLNARWQPGPRRGWVEASFDDMAKALGWSQKTLQRTIEDLEAKPYIEVERATNQYELTRIRILKYDLEESTSAVDKSDRSRPVGVDCAVDRGVDRGVDKSDRSAVHSKPASAQSRQDLCAPKKEVEVKEEVKEEKKGKADAVRRRFDAELRDVHQPEIQGRGFPPSKPSPQGEATKPHHQGFSSLKRKEKLEARIAHKLMESGNTLNRKFDDEEREAFAFIKYDPEYPSNLSNGFVYEVVDAYMDHKDDGLLLGNLCSKIIDSCMSEQESYKNLGMDPSEYYYPLDFVEHRDRLRARERIHGRAVHAGDRVRA